MFIQLFIVCSFQFLAGCSFKRNSLRLALGSSLQDAQTDVFVSYRELEQDTDIGALCQPEYCFKEQNNFFENIQRDAVRGLPIRTDVEGLEKICGSQGNVKECVESQTEHCGSLWLWMSNKVRQYGRILTYMCREEGKSLYASLDGKQCNFDVDIDLEISTCMTDIVSRINTDLINNHSREEIVTEGMLCLYLTEKRDCLRNAFTKACGEAFASLVAGLDEIMNEKEYKKQDMEYGCLRQSSEMSD